MLHPWLPAQHADPSTKLPILNTLASSRWPSLLSAQMFPYPPKQPPPLDSEAHHASTFFRVMHAKTYMKACLLVDNNAFNGGACPADLMSTLTTLVVSGMGRSMSRPVDDVCPLLCHD